MDEEEDVIPPLTELGRYLENKDLFDHNDALPSCPIENQQAKAKSQYGFICGHNIPDIHEYVFTAVKSKIIPATSYLTEIIDRIRSWFCQQKDALMNLRLEVRGIILKRLKLLQSWQSSTQLLSKADMIAFQFSLEHRMLKESTLLKECSAKICLSTTELDRLVVRLQSVKREDPNYDNNSNAIILEIVAVRHSINALAEEMGKLLLSQSNSIGRFTSRTGGLPDKKPADERALEGEEEDVVPVSEVESTENSRQDRSIFENEVPETLEDNFYMSRDEVFELKTSDDPDEDVNFISSSASDEISMERRTIQAELMTQLRGSLSSRRADMQARENRAYLELYGTLPEEQEDYSLSKPWDVTSSLYPQSEASVFGNLNQHWSEPSESRNIGSNAPDTYGDEIEECEDLEVKSEFLTSLQDLLRKRGGCC